MFLATHGILRSGSAEVIPYSNTKSIELDGIADYVTMGDTLDFERTDAFSISAWVKRGSTGVNDTIVSKMESSGNFRGYLLFIGSTNVVKFVLRHQNNSTARLFVDSTSTITDTNWHHISVTYDGSSSVSGVKIYIDGVSDTVTTSGTLNATTLNSSPFNIGARNNNSLFANANIDEVSVFNSELSQTDVNTIWNNGVPSEISSLNPISFWRCGDGDTLPILTDNGSGGNDGTMVSFTTFSTDVPLFDNKSFEYDGLNDYVEISNPSAFYNTGDFSLSVWVKYTSTLSSRNIINLVDNKAVYISGGKLLGFFRNSGGSFKSISTSLNYNDGNWHNLVFTKDNTNLTLYVDGSQVAQNSLGGVGQSGGTANARLGARSLSSPSNYFIGKSDEPAYFDYKLTSSDVTNIYGLGYPTDLAPLTPVGWWRAENVTWNGSSFDIVDSGSGGNDAESISMTLASRSSDVPT